MVTGGLPAVDPDRRCTVHSDSETGPRRRVFGWYEAGKEAACQRVARVGEGGLNDRVVLWEEVKLDIGANGSDDVVWAILKQSACTDSDFDS